MTNTQNTSPGVTLFVVSAVQFLTPFMASAVGVALPSIGKEFNASAVQLALIEMTYMLAVSIFLLPVGRFADIHGRKRVFISGTALMTLATIILSIAQDINYFIFFRFIQGAGAAMITSTSFAILSSTFPPKQRGKAMGIIVACIYIGLSAGPTIAGVMITHLGWRWVFYTTILIEVAAFLLTCLKLKGEWAQAKGQPFDWAGSILFMISMFCIIFGTMEMNNIKSGKQFLVSGLLGMILFLLFESKTKSPILDVNLLIENLTFTLSNIATWINYAASFGILFLFSLYLQSVKNFSPQTTGFILIVQPIIQAFCSPMAGKMSDRYPPAKIATIGMTICSIGLAIAITLNENSSINIIFFILALLGFGFGVFSSPNMNAIMGSVEPEHYAVASSIIATMRSMGMLTSMTIITVILNLFLGKQPVNAENSLSFIKSMHTSFIVFTLMSIIGIVCSLGRIKKNTYNAHT